MRWMRVRGGGIHVTLDDLLKAVHGGLGNAQVAALHLPDNELWSEEE